MGQERTAPFATLEKPPALRVVVTGLAHKASGFSPASFRSYVLSTVFRRNAAFETDHGIRQIRLICKWVRCYFLWVTYTSLENPASPAPQKWLNRG